MCANILTNWNFAVSFIITNASASVVAADNLQQFTTISGSTAGEYIVFLLNL